MEKARSSFQLWALVWLTLLLVLSPLRAEDLPRQGLVLWLDASEVRPATPIRTWPDKSGQGNHLQQLDRARQPTGNPKGLVNRPVVSFDGGQALHLDKMKTRLRGDSAFHVFFVFRAGKHPKSPNPRLLELRSLGGKSVDRTGFWVGYQGNGKNRLGGINGDEGEARSVSWDERPHWLEVVYRGGQQWEQYLDGRPDGRGVYRQRTFHGFSPPIAVSVGQHFGLDATNTFFRGDLAEVLLYETRLEPHIQNRVGDYLSRKYGLSTSYGPVPTFAKDVRPLLQKRCIGCHGKKQKGGLDLRTMTSILQGGSSGPVVVPTHPERSELVRMVRGGAMPPEGYPNLEPSEVALLDRWVRYTTTPSSALPTTTFTDEQSGHWAFQQLSRPPSPQSQRRSADTPLDAFIRRRLDSIGASLAPRAPKEMLARRLYLDLIGLPPRPDQLAEFLDDERPEATDTLIDGLLASPHFGERWGRHWLDVVGYVDVFGSDNDANTINVLPNKWRYRDYVIASFNADKPFDQFVVEQLAGDELFDWRGSNPLTPDRIDKLVATGYLLAAADDTHAPELNTPDIRHRVFQQTGEVVANSLLALTLQCAKCHDHKYEPIPQLDYYRFLGNFGPAFDLERWKTAKQHQHPRDKSIQAIFEEGSPSPTYLLWRGDYTKPSLEVRPSGLSILGNPPTSKPAPSLAWSSGRRLRLARQLTTPNTRASALLARVYVNRIWQNLFGVGLVSTSDNFGLSGAKPSHPLLLEWLASEFVRNGWRTKPLIRLIVRSRVYQQTSTRPNYLPGKKGDPSNSLLWRQRLRRAESEILRDAMLVCSGELDTTMRGLSLALQVLPSGRVQLDPKKLSTPSARGRRSVYILARRNYHHSLLNVFDQPVVSSTCSRRNSAPVVTQSLTLLNDEFVLQQAKAFADRITSSSSDNDESQDIVVAFRIALAREPTSSELALCQQTLERHLQRYRSRGDSQEQASVKALTHLCHVLMNSSEFLYIP